MKNLSKILLLMIMVLPFVSVRAQSQTQDQPNNVLIQFQATTFTDVSFDVTVDGVLFPQLTGGEWLNITSGIHLVTIAQRPRECERAIDIDLPVEFTTPDLDVGTYILGMHSYTVIKDDVDQPTDTADISLFHEYGIFRVPPDVIGRAFVPMTNTGHPNDPNYLAFDVYYKGIKIFGNLEPGEAILIPYENGTPRILGGIEYSLPDTGKSPSKFSLQDVTKYPKRILPDPVNSQITRTLVFGDFTAGPVGPVDLNSIDLLPTDISNYVNALAIRADCIKQLGLDKKQVVSWIDNSGVASLATAFAPSMNIVESSSIFNHGLLSGSNTTLSGPKDFILEPTPNSSNANRSCFTRIEKENSDSGYIQRPLKADPCWVPKIMSSRVHSFADLMNPTSINSLRGYDELRWTPVFPSEPPNTPMYFSPSTRPRGALEGANPDARSSSIRVPLESSSALNFVSTNGVPYQNAWVTFENTDTPSVYRPNYDYANAPAIALGNFQRSQLSENQHGFEMARPLMETFTTSRTLNYLAEMQGMIEVSIIP